ncbi:MAG: rhodanese-like domain-containing protein [Anaerosomatales bacterium]|nr:rhodanese-like domain-containing protein [Anaerosomatales bacterium]
MKNRWLVILLSFVLALGMLGGLAGCGSNGGSEEPEGPAVEGPAAEEPVSARDEYLISINDVAADMESFVIIDARAPEAYEAGHLAGAINAPWQTFASVGEGAPGDPEWGTLLPVDDIGAKLGELGVDTSKTIVVYTDPTGWGEDGRIVWMLRALGIEDSLMMDGGYPAWAAAGNEITTDAVALEATTVAVVDDLAEYNVATDDLVADLDAFTIIDSRSTKEYEGATDFGEARGGHIAGAVSIPYPEVFNVDGTVKSDEELLALLEGAGVDDTATENVFYCTKGIRSAHMSLLARMLGYENARNYDASFYTWAGNPDLPVE